MLPPKWGIRKMTQTLRESERLFERTQHAENIIAIDTGDDDTRAWL